MSAAATLATPTGTLPASGSSVVGGGVKTSPAAVVVSPAICRYFQRGICRFGALCRFSHDLPGGDVISSGEDDINDAAVASSSSFCRRQVDAVQSCPSTSAHHRDWVNAPVFVPKSFRTAVATEEISDCADGAFGINHNYESGAIGNSHKSWADVVGGGAGGASGVARVGVLTAAESEAMLSTVCPYEGPCPYVGYCMYGIHMDLCKMCDQYCLHPSDQGQRRKHNQECLQQHEQAMELSFAIARSKDKTCGICFDTIMEKSGREKRFGILPNCNHIFCLECIRKWRQAKQFDHKITRSCPECRVCSDFVCPSAFWVETKEEKDKLLSDYRSALGVKDCKYFKKGDGKCPFGNKCFYKHALPNGDLVDVGCPKRARKLHRGDEIIDLLDIYLWEFVEQRDYHWLDFLSATSDENSDTEFSDD